MQWKISDAKGSGIDYIGYAETTPISEAVSELWRKYAEDAAPKNAELLWNYLGVYIYLDSGRVILFPVVQSSRHRVDKATCQIICPDLLASYNDVADSNLPDAKFEIWADQATERVASLVSQAAKQAKLPEVLGVPEVRILYYSYDSEQPMREEILKPS